MAQEVFHAWLPRRK